MLLLFDIDGTLLQRATDAHRDAIHEALRKVHGVEAVIRHGHEVAGRTDTEIARGLLLTAGVSAERIDERADAVRVAACEAYVRLCPDDLSEHVTPGFQALLQALAARGRHRLALLTGNYEVIARVKLRAAGLGGFFPGGQGGFGSDHEDRTELPAIARRRAGERGSPWPRRQTVVIGDTPRDIACARADGVRVIAVATGPYEASALVEADAVAHDARELAALLDDLA